MNEYQELSKEITKLICSLAENRKNNAKFVVDTDENEKVEHPNWVIDERKALTDFINKKRAERKQSPVSTNDVLCKVENPAVGHCDYGQKIGFYAANLILQET